MSDDAGDRADEPSRNISGGPGGGGEHIDGETDADDGEHIDGADTRPTAGEAPVEDGEPETRAEAVVDELGEIYWQKAYGGQDAFECLVRTILSQNTSDKASQPAHDSLMSRFGGDDTDLAESLAAAEQDELAETIASAGLYNQ